MAKLTGLFNYDGTFQGVTTVHSRAYGKHIRKAREKFTRSEEMKESSALMAQANVYAKVFKDAIDPYRRDFRDGQLWQRLVSLFKTQLKETGEANFSALEGQDLNKIHPLNRIISVSTTTVTPADNNLNIHITSRCSKDQTKGRADGYHQTVIALFVDKTLQVRSFSQSTFISLKADPGEQKVSFEIPDDTTTAIVVLKCNFGTTDKPMGLQKSMGMRVVKVVEVGLMPLT